MSCPIWAPKFGVMEGNAKTTVLCRKKLSQMNVLRSEKWDESKKYVFFFFFFEVIGLAD